MNLGRRPGPLARWLMRPFGWPTLLLMFAATVAIVVTTRPQAGSVWTWDFAFHDLLYYTTRDLRDFDQPLTDWTDVICISGVAACTASLLFAVVRTCLGFVARRIYSGPRGVFWPSRRSLAAVALLCSVSVLCIGYGWAYRLGVNWATKREAYVAPMPAAVTWQSSSPVPFSSSISKALPEEALVRMLSSARTYGNARARAGAVALLVEGDVPPLEQRIQLLDTIDNDADESLRATAVRLLGLIGHPDDSALLRNLLDDAATAIREAAADALASRQDPAITSLFSSGGVYHDLSVKHGGMRIWFAVHSSHSHRSPLACPWQDGTAEKLMELVQRGPTAAERDAAAHALAVRQPASKTLAARYMEFGVWHADGSDDRPAGESLPDGVIIQGSHGPWTGTHVAHLSAREPSIMGIQLEVAFGNVTHAQPTPDEQSDSLKRRYGLMPFRVMASPAWHRPRYGHLSEPTFTRRAIQGAHDLLMSSGVLWRSLAVQKDRPAWIGIGDSNPSSADGGDIGGWLTTRGEAVQSLRYRSSRRNPPALPVEIVDGKLHFDSPDVHTADPVEEQPDYESVITIDAQDQTARRGRRTQRRGMYLSVVKGVPTAEIVPVPASGKEPSPANHVIGSGIVVREDVPALLRDWIIDAGLTPAEANAHLAEWNKSFFETDGRRFLLLLSAVDYDSVCPIHINPRPTDMARVGIVWTEFDNSDKHP